MRRPALWLVPLVLSLLALPLVVLGAGEGAEKDAAEREYRMAAAEFHRLAKTSQAQPKSNRQSNGVPLPTAWEQVAGHFAKIAADYPHHRRGPDALFSAGLAYRRGHEASEDAEWFSHAVEAFHHFVSIYPAHLLADDCLMHIGEIFDRSFNDPYAAYLEYRKVLELYPLGDQVALATQRAAALRGRLDDTLQQPVTRVPSTTAAVTAVAQPKPSANQALQSESTQSESAPGRPLNPSPSGGEVTLKRIQHLTTPEWTRVILTLSGGVKYRHARLPADGESAPRLYVDLPETALAADLVGAVSVADKRLERIRIGRQDASTVRVVLDLNQVARYEVMAFDLPLESKVVVDLHTSVAAETAELINTQPQPQPQPQPQSEIEPSGPSTALSLNRALGLKVGTIVLDPGHGGRDPGATAFGLQEKLLTLQIAKHLRDIFRRKRPDLNVVLTREDDRFVQLGERPRIAQQAGADLFVSIHVNAHEVERISGVETYFLNLTSDASALKVAARENATGDKQISDLYDILLDLKQDTNLIESGALAKTLQSSLVKTLRSGNRVRDLGVKQAPFMVLLGSDVPSVLVEAGFITNRKENLRLKQESYLNKIAQGIYAGLSAYIEQQLVAGGRTAGKGAPRLLNLAHN